MRKSIAGTLPVLFLLAAVAAAPSWAQEAGALDATRTLRDNLKQLQASGKPAELVLKNGKSYGGKLAAVGDHAVVVTEVTGREFFDALIVIDDIVAVEVRARGR
jgi:hypothetical protein